MTTTTQKKTATKAKTVQVKKSEPAPVVDKLPANPFIFEVLDLVSRQRSNVKKVEVLKKYEDLSIKAIFIWNFDETVISLLPEGPVPYAEFDDQTVNSGTLSTKITEEVRKMHETGSFSKGSSDKQGHTTIRKEFKNFYHFVKGGNDGLNNIRRESMFINLLQGLHPLESEILILCKDKKLGEKYKITKEIVAEAYPDIQWGGRS